MSIGASQYGLKGVFFVFVGVDMSKWVYIEYIHNEYTYVYIYRVYTSIAVARQ